MKNSFYISNNYTKHYYAGTQRVSSKIGTTENLGDYLYDWFTQGTGGPIDVVGSSFGVLENAEDGVVQVYNELGIEPPAYDSNPVFIPVQSYVHGGSELEQYYFHPDHLGSTSYITNLLGEVSQHMEYFAFGETFVEEHRSSNNSPYKFNGKELDEETGLYYYGARYYDPRVSVWLSVDPLTEQTMTPYQYTYQNPINFIDPKGMQGEDPPSKNVRILIDLQNTPDGTDALKTRKKEIERSYPEDKIITLEVSDLGKLKSLVENNLKTAKEEGYGSTIEVAFFGHGGMDGPIGSEPVSGNYNLANETYLPEDRNQLSPKGWGAIDWNFDPEKSLAAFYGCNTAGFAEQFLSFTNVKYAAGITGGAGGSKTFKGGFNASWFGLGKVYMVAVGSDNQVLPTFVYKRGKRDENTGYLIPIEVNGNASINKEGVLTSGSK